MPITWSEWLGMALPASFFPQECVCSCNPKHSKMEEMRFLAWRIVWLLLNLAVAVPTYLFCSDPAQYLAPRTLHKKRKDKGDKDDKHSLSRGRDKASLMTESTPSSSSSRPSRSHSIDRTASPSPAPSTNITPSNSSSSLSSMLPPLQTPATSAASASSSSSSASSTNVSSTSTSTSSSSELTSFLTCSSSLPPHLEGPVPFLTPHSFPLPSGSLASSQYFYALEDKSIPQEWLERTLANLRKYVEPRGRCIHAPAPLSSSSSSSSSLLSHSSGSHSSASADAATTLLLQAKRSATNTTALNLYAESLRKRSVAAASPTPTPISASSITSPVSSSLLSLGIPPSPSTTPSASSSSLIPPNKKKKRYTLVLDLDETLVHTTDSPMCVYDCRVEIHTRKARRVFYILKRPFLDTFLLLLSAHFEIVIFTASIRRYADAVIDLIDVHGVVSRRLFRQSCVKSSSGAFLKDLLVISPDLRKTLLIDNSPIAYTLQQENALPIATWYDDPNDTALRDLIPFLIALRSVDDIRPILHRRWSLQLMAEKNGTSTPTFSSGGMTPNSASLGGSGLGTNSNGRSRSRVNEGVPRSAEMQVPLVSSIIEEDEEEEEEETAAAAAAAAAVTAGRASSSNEHDPNTSPGVLLQPPSRSNSSTTLMLRRRSRSASREHAPPPAPAPTVAAVPS